MILFGVFRNKSQRQNTTANEPLARWSSFILLRGLRNTTRNQHKSPEITRSNHNLRAGRPIDLPKSIQIHQSLGTPKKAHVLNRAPGESPDGDVSADPPDPWPDQAMSSWRHDQAHDPAGWEAVGVRVSLRRLLDELGRKPVFISCFEAIAQLLGWRP